LAVEDLNVCAIHRPGQKVAVVVSSKAMAPSAAP